MKRFEKITKLIPPLEAEGTHGEWIIDTEHEGTPDDPNQLPSVSYGEATYALIKAVHECVDENEDLDVRDYRGVLESYGIHDAETILAANISKCDARCTLAMILAIVRSDRFCEGLLLEYLENGIILKWMKRLEEIDSE